MKEFIEKKLLAAINRQELTGRVASKDLGAGDEILVKTKHSTYKMVKGESNKFQVTSDNKKYSGPYEAILIGTTVAPGASTISPGNFTVGGSMELWVKDLEDKEFKIITSEVKSVSINGITILPIKEEVN